MRLPIVVANAIRTRKLIEPDQHVLVALSGGPDSVALLNCMLELSKKRDLAFTISAAHLHHGLRAGSADADEKFCKQLCDRKKIKLLRAFVDTPKLAAQIKRSHEETARIARHAFLAAAAVDLNCACVAVAHHADDRIETVLYRLCRGTGLAGIQGIGWSGPLLLEGEPEVGDRIEWRDHLHVPQALRAAPDINQAAQLPLQVVRPLLGCTRAEVLAYLRSKRATYCTDETNFDDHIPRNAVRNLVLPLLAGKVHPGTRQALWRLAEEAEAHAEKRDLRREWLAAFATLGTLDMLVLPVSRMGTPPAVDELIDALNVLKAMWKLQSTQFTHRHAQALRRLFPYTSGPKSIDLPGGLVAQRRGKEVIVKRNFRARDLF